MHAEPPKNCTDKSAYKIQRRQSCTKFWQEEHQGTEKIWDLKLAHAYVSNHRKHRGDRETEHWTEEKNGETEREAVSWGKHDKTHKDEN